MLRDFNIEAHKWKAQRPLSSSPNPSCVLRGMSPYELHIPFNKDPQFCEKVSTVEFFPDDSKKDWSIQVLSVKIIVWH